MTRFHTGAGVEAASRGKKASGPACDDELIGYEKTKSIADSFYFVADEMRGQNGLSGNMYMPDTYTITPYSAKGAFLPKGILKFSVIYFILSWEHERHGLLGLHVSSSGERGQGKVVDDLVVDMRS